MSIKDKLLKVLKNPNDKLIAVDMDGVLCKGEFWGEDEPKPILENIEYFNRIYKKGGHIIIYTARNPKWYALTQNWLDKFGVMYHGIAMMKKIGADVYIDDKALNIDDLNIMLDKPLIGEEEESESMILKCSNCGFSYRNRGDGLEDFNKVDETGLCVHCSLNE